MQTILNFFLFLFGVSLGSFINVVSLRYDPGKSLWSMVGRLSTKNRSHCPHCQKTLAWYELIPIVSFAIQAGHCRSCGKKLSWQYPIVELLMGGLAVVIGERISPISLIGLISLIFSLLLLASLVAIALIDLRTSIIPDELIIISLVLTFLTFLTSLADLKTVFYSSKTIGLLFGGGVLTALWALGRGRWMGLGDGKLGAVLGLWLGWPGILLALAAAFISGTIVSVGLLISRKKTVKDAIPFGPFLVLGAITAFFLKDWWHKWWQMLGL